MKTLRVTVLISLLALLLITASSASSQGTGPQQPDAPAAAVAAAISYQGRLVHPTTGAPLSGIYDLEFTFWSLSGGGSQIGATIARNAQLITNGLYSTQLEVDPANVNGQELWLRIRVRTTGGTWETLTPRVQVLPTAYALSLRPGALIQGPPTAWTDGWVLGVNMTGTYPLASAVRGSTATGSAIRGNSTGGYGLYGYSENGNGLVSTSISKTAGIFSSSEGYGIRVSTNGSDHWDHAGYFTANWGYGIYVTSTHNIALRAMGGTDLTDVSQPVGRVGVAGLSATSFGVVGSSRDTAGVRGYSHDSSGVIGSTDRTDNNYGLYTNDNLYSLNYHLMGAVMQVVQNGGTETLEAGDVVVFSGLAAPLEKNGPPVIRIAKATASNSTAVAGVVYSRFNLQAITDQHQSDGSNSAIGLEVTPAGSVPSGEYLLMVIQGPTQVKASALAGAGIQPGDLLSTAQQAGHAGQAATVSIDGIITTLPGTVLGKALEPLSADQKLIYVFVTLQ